MWKEADIKEAVKGLILAAGVASDVAQADIRQVAYEITRRYGEARSREIEAEITRHLRNRG